MKKRRPLPTELMVRAYYPHALVDRLDELVEKVRLASGRKASRCAVLRALARLYLDELLPLPKGINMVPILANLIGQDPIRRGRRPKARKPKQLPLPSVAAVGADPELPKRSPRPRTAAEGP